MRENWTILDVTARALHLDAVIEVDSYLAAAGLVLALRSGIAVDTLRRPLGAVGAHRAVDTASVRHRDALRAPARSRLTTSA